MHFVDTNVLLYSISPDASESHKRGIARSLLLEPDFALSVQILQEFYVQATRLSRPGRLTHEQAVGLIMTWSRLPIQELTPAIVMRAIASSQRFQISYWDAAVLEAARTAGCATVLSEDLQHGQDFDGVRVINPFL